MLFLRFNRFFSGHLVKREQILALHALGLILIGYHQQSTASGAGTGEW